MNPGPKGYRRLDERRQGNQLLQTRKDPHSPSSSQMRVLDWICRHLEVAENIHLGYLGYRLFRLRIPHTTMAIPTASQSTKAISILFTPV